MHVAYKQHIQILQVEAVRTRLTVLTWLLTNTIAVDSFVVMVALCVRNDSWSFLVVQIAGTGTFGNRLDRIARVAIAYSLFVLCIYHGSQ